MKKSNQFKEFMIENPAKARMYLSLFFSILMVIFLKDMLVEELGIFIYLFLLAPVVIYLVTVYIFKKK